MADNTPINESNLAAFATQIIQQQLDKGAAKGYSAFEDSSVTSLVTQAIGKLVTGNWQSALAYTAMAVAVWWNDKNASGS